MVKVQVIVSNNCANCVKVEKMLDEMDVKYEVIDVVENPEILKKYQVMCAPGVVIDGKLEFCGEVSKEDLIKKLK